MNALLAHWYLFPLSIGIATLAMATGMGVPFSFRPCL